MNSELTPGVCRHCKCTESNACRLENGEPCCWFDNEKTVCSNPACIRAEQARLAQEKRSKPRKRFSGWGYGAIVEELRRDKRRRRRKAA